MSEITSIQVTKETRKRLQLWKVEQEMTYDEAVNHLLSAYADGGETDD